MTITIPVKDWLLIDATVDNTVAIAAHDGHSRRRALDPGERMGIVPQPPQGWTPVGWPPEDDELTLDLSVEAWRFVIDQLRRWDKVDDLINPRSEGDPESRKQARVRMLEERVS